MSLAERVCELLPKAQLTDCLTSRAARQAHADWVFEPTPAGAELVALMAWRSEFYLFDDARRALDEALRAWSLAQRGVRSRAESDALIARLSARYGKEA